MEPAEDHVVGIKVLRHAEHGGMAEFRGRGQAVTLELADPARTRIHLFSGGGEPGNHEMLQAFAQPIKVRRRSVVLKGENKIDAARSCRGTRFRQLFSLQARNGKKRRKENRNDYPGGGDAEAHARSIVTEEMCRGRPTSGSFARKFGFVSRALMDLKRNVRSPTTVLRCRCAARRVAWVLSRFSSAHPCAARPLLVCVGEWIQVGLSTGHPMVRA